MVGLMDIHARIQEFLQENFPLPLREGAGGGGILEKEDASFRYPPSLTLPLKRGGNLYTKAGVVPFLRDPYRYYLMKPMAKNLELDAPEFQLCKGTRMMKIDDAWVDIPSSFPSPPVGEAGAKRRERGCLNEGSSKIPPLPQGEREVVLESLAATALREGIEELGLKLKNIKELFDLGPYGFSSATTGKSKEMWLFAAEMAQDDFSDEVAETTADRTWLTMPEFNVAGREDHRYILRDIEKKLNQ